MKPDKQRNARGGGTSVFVLLLTVFGMPAFGDETGTMDAEIDFLIESVAASECVFIRNGREHSAAKARDHLQMKRRRGKRYYDTTEEFIERIASKSSWSGKAYQIRCGDSAAVKAKDWFDARLADFRSGAE